MHVVQSLEQTLYGGVAGDAPASRGIAPHPVHEDVDAPGHCSDKLLLVVILVPVLLHLLKKNEIQTKNYKHKTKSIEIKN